MGGLASTIYAHSPVFVQNIGINAFGWYWARRRLGRVFADTTAAYVAREGWPPERMRAYVEQQLRAIVLRAYDEVPYYREQFGRYGLTREMLARLTPDDLRRLPLLEKQAIRANPRLIMTDRAVAHPPASFSTSGSTGTPLRVYMSVDAHQRVIAAREARSFRWAGVSIRDGRSMIGGRMIVPRPDSGPPFWRYNLWEKQLYLSAYHITPANAPHYVAALNRYRPAAMTGYASANFFLARMIADLQLEVHSPRALILGSEKTEPHMRATLESVYRSRVFEEYGSAENVVLATECERGRLHVHPDFGCMEILRPDGTAAAPGEPGEVVVTGLSNTDQLFIRYRIGDVAAWDDAPCPCGRESLPVLRELVGRQEDTVIAPNGLETVRFHGIFVDLPQIVEGQIIQQRLDTFTVNIVTTQGCDDALRQAIHQRMYARLGRDITVEVCPVDTIPRGPNGKFRAVISHVPRQT